MNELRKLPDPFDGFRKGSSGAFRYYFLLYRYRIYYYLLGLTRNKKVAWNLTKIAFIRLIKIYAKIRDADHLLRSLYLLSKIARLLHLRGKCSASDLETEFAFYSIDDPNIMDDPQVVRNETLITLQEVLQRLPSGKKEVAELYFFQGLRIRHIAKYKRMNEQIVKEYLLEVIRLLGNDLARRSKDRDAFWRAVPVVTPC